MQAARGSPFVSPSPVEAVPTDVDTESPVTRDDGHEEQSREAWQKVIDDRLIEWGWNPSQFDDEGIEPPSRETVTLAVSVAEVFREEGRAAPTRVVPDAHGGIVFERQEGEVFETIRIGADAVIEYCLFLNSRLADREFRYEFSQAR